VSRWTKVPPGTITEREQQMIRMLVDGKTCRQIARVLSLQPNSVSMQFGRAAARIGIPGATRVHLAVECLRRGLLADPEQRHADECDVHIPRACTCHRAGVAATVLAASGGRP
jgi:DNA-binding CsgD family transcriptional regulator